MLKLKPIVISAAAAFVFSFFTAMIAHSGFPVSLLKAFIFAVIFGGLALGIEFVYGKFLSEGAAPAPEVQEAPKAVGGRVDLVVSEEDLPDEGGSPSFLVEGRHVISQDDVGSAPIDEGDVSAARQNEVLEAAENVRSGKAAENIVSQAASDGAKKTEAPAEAASPATPAAIPAPPAQKESAFVPLDLTAKDVAESGIGGGAASPASPSASPVQEEGPAESPAGAGSPLDEDLDELPDIAELGGNPEAAEEGVVEDSDFAQEGSVQIKRQTEMPDGTVASVKDAPLMAEAIRTVLKKEEG